MTESFPDYYHKFSCIADRCRHNCCIGWEIDIDSDTMQLYSSLAGEMGERIRKAVSGDIPHFVLDTDERCPFLNSSGLCDIICEYGEGALCDICSMHPRFRNFYSSFTETGLGMCCEEAARIIITEKEKFNMSVPAGTTLTPEEEAFFAKRQEIFDILQDRELAVGERFSALSAKFELQCDLLLPDVCDFYMELEQLDSDWTQILTELRGFSFDKAFLNKPELQLPLEQLAVYFVFRHLGEAAYDDSFGSYLKFALLSCCVIAAIFAMQCSKGKSGMEFLIEAARMYSAEIEYSQENIDEIMLFCL